MSYKFLEHTADIKIEVKSRTLEEAFISSAAALKEVVSGDIKAKSKIEKKIEIEAKDRERLLYEFLEHFLFLLDAEDFLFSSIKSLNISQEKMKQHSKIKSKSSNILNKSSNFKLKATILGDNASNYTFSNNVKAITYNDMIIKQNNNSFLIQFVLDV